MANANVSTVVEVVGAMPAPTLSRLLKEYTERLEQQSKLLFDVAESNDRFFGSKPKSRPIEGTEGELVTGVDYLFKITLDLLDLGSATLESGDLSAGDTYDLKLRLFDAERVLRIATRVLDATGAKFSTSA